MNLKYRDILERIKEEPHWYDQNGTPRYGKFEPDLCPDIYARHCGLFLISCQDCGSQFFVEMHSGYMDYHLKHPPTKWHYGDPPAHGCTGDSMNCEDHRIIEFYAKDPYDYKLVEEFTQKEMS